MAHEAERARAQAQTMPPGKDRDALTERAVKPKRRRNSANAARLNREDIDASEISEL
jgi:hypothetical protein